MKNVSVSKNSNAYVRLMDGTVDLIVDENDFRFVIPESRDVRREMFKDLFLAASDIKHLSEAGFKDVSVPETEKDLKRYINGRVMYLNRKTLEMSDDKRKALFSELKDIPEKAVYPVKKKKQDNAEKGDDAENFVQTEKEIVKDREILPELDMEVKQYETEQSPYHTKEEMEKINEKILDRDDELVRERTDD